MKYVALLLTVLSFTMVLVSGALGGHYLSLGAETTAFLWFLGVPTWAVGGAMWFSNTLDE